MWTDDNAIWHVRHHETPNVVWIGSAYNREDAKRKAHRWIGGNADNYFVTPLTEKKDKVKLEITLAT